MSIYKGFKTREIGSAIVWKDNATLSPVASQKVWNHSPDGFEWGYGGSGPAQLALALLLDVTGVSTLAVQLYQDFKREFVATWGEEWEISDDQIKAWIAQKQAPVEEKLAAWIDTSVIAQNLLDALKDGGAQVTEFNAQAVWLDMLYTEISDAMKRSIKALVDKGEIS